MRYSAFILILFVISSCCKKDSDTIDPRGKDCLEKEVESSLQVIWKYPILPDTSEGCTTSYPIVTDKGVIFAITFCDGDDVGLFYLDKLTGELIWKNDQFPSYIMETSDIDDWVNKDIMVSMIGLDTRAFSMRDGSLLWDNRKDSESYSDGGEVIGDRIYRGFRDGDYHSLYRKSIHNVGSWEKIYSSKSDSSFQGWLLGMTPHVNENGDSLLYFHHSQWSNPLFESRTYLHCLNIESKELVWKSENVGVEKHSSFAPMVFYNDIIVYKDRAGVSGFNKNTGEELWQTNLYERSSGDLLSGNMVVHNNYVIAKSSNGYLFAIDANNGDIVWENDKVSSWSDNLYLDEGLVYFGDNGFPLLHVVDAQTGEIIIKETSPNQNCFPNSGFSFSGVSVDENAIYTSDNYFFMALKKP